MLAIMLASVVATSGCLGGDDAATLTDMADANETETTTDAPTINHEEHAQATEASADAVAAVEASEALTSLHSMQLYMTPDLALVDAPPEAGSIPMPATWSSCFAAPPCHHLTFQSEPMREPWALVPGVVTFDLWVVADVPMASTTIFDFAGWFGSDVDVSAFAQGFSGNILPGEPVRVTFEAQHPATPNVLFVGDSFTALILAAMTNEAPGTLHLLTGGETASSIQFTMARVDPVALTLGAESKERVEGEFSGPAFPVSDATGPSERSLAIVPIEVPDDAQLLRIDVNGAMATGVPDIDLDLMSGSNVVGSGHTPRSTETIRLAGPALDGLRGTTLDLHVKLFYGQAVSYAVDVTTR